MLLRATSCAEQVHRYGHSAGLRSRYASCGTPRQPAIYFELHTVCLGHHHHSGKEYDWTVSATLNNTDATIGTPFNTAQIQALPFEGTNIMDLLSLQAGVTFTGAKNQNSATDTRAGSVNGARSDRKAIFRWMVWITTLRLKQGDMRSMALFAPRAIHWRVFASYYNQLKRRLQPVHLAHRSHCGP